MVSRSTKPKKAKALPTYSWTTMLAISVNYIIGTGLLALPRAAAGLPVFTTLSLLLIAVITTTMLAVYCNDAIARAFALRRADFAYSSRKKKPTELESTKVPMSVSSSQSLLQNLSVNINCSTGCDAEPYVIQEEPIAVESQPTMIPDYSIPNHEIMAFSDLMQVFFGRGGFYFYQVVIIIYMFTALWSYGNVVASSMASVVPLTFIPSYISGGHTKWLCAGPCEPDYYPHCDESYWIWLAITTVVACILVFFNVAEQKALQTVFTYCRFLVIVIVIGVSGIALGIAPYETPAARVSPPYGWQGRTLLGFDAVMAGKLFSTLIFTMIFHTAIPDLVGFLRKSDHKRMNMAFYLTCGIVLCILILIMYLCGGYFGANGPSLVTLNFTSWDGVSWQSSTDDNPWWATLVAYVTRLLPPLYVITAIPINAIIMANNLDVMYPPRLRKNKAVRCANKLISVVPAMVTAGFARCLDTILNFAGLLGYLIVLTPGLMSFFGALRCKRAFGAAHVQTPFTNWTNQPIVMLAIFVVICLAIILTLYSLIKPLTV